MTPQRTEAGYRDYGTGDEESVRQIKVLGIAGMTLPVVRNFLPCALGRRGEFEPCDELRETVRGQIDRVNTRIADLAESRSVLEGILDTLQTPPKQR